MIRISDALNAILAENSLLQMGLQQDLLNLSKTAEHLKPLVEARTQKTVQGTAIHMHLSRMRRRLKKTDAAPPVRPVEHLSVHSGLCAMTFLKTPTVHRRMHKLYDRILAAGGYMTITEGVGEVTALLDQDYLKTAQTTLEETPKETKTGLASIALKFTEKALAAPGLLHRILQTVALQNISLVEIASTRTEFILYLDQKDLRLAFDTLMNAYGK